MPANPLHWIPIIAQDPPAAEGDGEGGGGGLFGGSSTPMIMAMVLIFVLAYFMLIRPEKKKRSQMEDMLKNLKKSDKVETIGGIIGVVSNVQKQYVTLRIDEGTGAKLKIRRSAISRIVTDDKEMDDSNEPAEKLG